jgi:hypothetical protein
VRAAAFFVFVNPKSKIPGRARLPPSRNTNHHNTTKRMNHQTTKDTKDDREK